MLGQEDRITDTPSPLTLVSHIGYRYQTFKINNIQTKVSEDL